MVNQACIERMKTGAAGFWFLFWRLQHKYISRTLHSQRWKQTSCLWKLKRIKISWERGIPRDVCSMTRLYIHVSSSSLSSSDHYLTWLKCPYHWHFYFIFILLFIPINFCKKKNSIWIKCNPFSMLEYWYIERGVKNVQICCHFGPPFAAVLGLERVD